MKIEQVSPDDELYPGILRALLGAAAPTRLQMQGEIGLLDVPKLAFFCSSKCPGAILNKAYDLANGLRQNLLAVMGGFHAPMEKEWLQILLNSATPIIRCPARDLMNRRLTEEDHRLSAKNRLLLLAFGSDVRRATKESAFYRNVCMAALAETIFIAHASVSSKTESLCRQVLQWGKPVYTFIDEHNDSLLQLGVVGVRSNDFLAQWLR